MIPTKQLICHLEKCSLDRAIELAKQYKDKIWGFSVYDLLFTDGFNSIYQLKKYGKVFADLRLDSHDIDYILQCAWAAGADLVSIKADSHKFTNNIASYSGCHKLYSYIVQESEAKKLLISESVQLEIISLAGLNLYFPPTESKINI